jgi:hypothetical protein
VLFDGTKLTLVATVTGTYDSTAYQEVDCTSLPNYHNLTINDFVFETIKISFGTRPISGDLPSQDVYDHSYNASTGILSVRANNVWHPDTWYLWAATINVYVK